MAQRRNNHETKKKSDVYFWVFSLTMMGIALFSAVAICFNYHKTVETYGKLSEELALSATKLDQIKDDMAPFRDELLEILNAKGMSTVTPAEITAADQHLEFMKTQIADYQAFIEREIQFWAQILAIIIAGVGGVFAFFGFKSKKDIEELMKTEYRSRIKEAVTAEVCEQLGDERVHYIQSLIEKDQKVREKKICFIQQIYSCEGFKSAIEEFNVFFGDKYKKHVFCVDSSRSLFSGLLANDKLNCADIIVYEVSKEEEGKGKTGMNYQTLHVYCKKENKKCMLYCKGFFIDQDSISPGSTTIAKFQSTLVSGIKEFLFS